MIAFNPVILSENPVIVAVTFWLVRVSTEYITQAVGAVVSIQSTVAVAVQVFPARSSKVNTNERFQVKVYQENHPLFVIVSGSEYQVNIAKTF